ncbi:MAG: type VI secretion protein IcmF/TssM N-terminal domain-containing protein [Thermodesulfobacteriota bacterium]
MLKLLWQALKILLVLVLLAALGVGLYFLVQRLHWPWWAGAAIFVGLLGLITAGLFLKKWLFRRREKKFVQRIVEHDESIILKKPVTERQPLLDLQARWREAVERLRASHLRQYGHPLYVLPWYLLLGGPGSGKTTAIRSARLHTPLTEIGPAAGIAGTRNCDWWFFDQAVVLDTAGRYAIPVDEGPDKEEWQTFLNLLIKYRRREPLNGVMITVSADELTGSRQDALAEEARALRRRLDELMRVLGAKLPIYLVVTKMDQVPGLVEYAESLSAGGLDQALGCINATLRHDPRAQVEESLNIVSGRLKDIRPWLLSSNPDAAPGLLLFPDELANLGPSLAAFAQTLFEENPYQETPLFRGLYFTSGRQTGRIHSRLLADTGVFKDYKTDLPGTDKGIFLRGLLTGVLPPDRHLISPLREFLSWRRMTRSLGLASWTALMACLCGLLTLSYFHNVKALVGFTSDIPRPPALTRDLVMDLALMDKFRSELIEIEQNNRDWWLPRLGLDQSLLVEAKLKDLYGRHFRHGLMDYLDRLLKNEMDGFTAQTPGEVIGDFARHLETRINLLAARLAGASTRELEKMPQPAYQALTTLDKHLSSQIAARFSPLYLSYLEWDQDQRVLNLDVSFLRFSLRRLIEIQGSNLHWLVLYANTHSGLPPVTLEDFWGKGRVADAWNIKVPPAFTVKGRTEIYDFIKRLRSALADPGLLGRLENEFNSWYQRQYLLAWENFGQGFDRVYIHIGGEDDRRTLAQIMADPKNPYFELMDRLAQELEPFRDQVENLPFWAKNTFALEWVKKEAARQKAAKTGGTLSKTIEAGEQALRKVAATPDAKEMKKLETVDKAAEQYNNYEKALTDCIPVTTSREIAFKMAVKLFSGEIPTGGQAAAGSAPGATEGASPFQDAHKAMTRLKNTTLTEAGRQDNVFWRLLTGPLDFLLSYAIHEAACELQVQWEGSVLAEVENVPEEKFRQALFDQNQGVVWKFVKGPAAGFLGRGAQGYFPRNFLNHQVPFDKSFLFFLDLGASRTQMALPEYEVTVASRPTNVNRGALLEPFATVLVLDCADGSQQIENFNYPSSQTFKWKPDKCGQATLKINFNDFTLTKVYGGVQGFPYFLEDFRNGSKTFTPSDFPARANDLKNINVKEIKVSYVISGSDPVRRLLRKEILQLPRTITACGGS